ncbi:EAL domain-containing protein [Pelagibacterium montanilacus]|uniref:EAL domain-containing protein n=1 Tax=Pelagibacterium montanilacus TaxID=2185280 RepID=UPI000F8E0A44|nr:EAL domain-containing protein [Pelagibacterium montanilacus]
MKRSLNLIAFGGSLPVDKIKIDQNSVRGLPESRQLTAIVRAVLMLAESLGKTVIAEGIETEDQAWMLGLAGCGMGQGYHFGGPGPADVLIEQVDEMRLGRLARREG